jgi:hypothetical protein
VRDLPTSTPSTIMFLPQQLKTLAPLRRQGRVLAIPNRCRSTKLTC